MSVDQYIVSFEDEDMRRPLIVAHWADEGRLMILRNRPVVIYVKDLEKKDEHSRFYSDLILHCPWNGEDEITAFGPMIGDLEICRDRHDLESASIDLVKERLRNLLLQNV